MIQTLVLNVNNNIKINSNWKSEPQITFLRSGHCDETFEKYLPPTV